MTPAQFRGWGDSRSRGHVVLIAAIAALPSMVWGFAGAGFLSDDWSVWQGFEQSGVVEALRNLAFEQPARPLAAPYYALIYLGVGDHPLVQALLMGAVNAALVVAVWLFARTRVPPTVLWAGLWIVALAPNRATTRLWFVVGTYPLALALALVALTALTTGRPVRASVLLAASTLLYEGTIVFALVVAAAWVVGDLRLRIRPTLGAAFPALVVAGAMFLASPKRTADSPGPLDNAGSFLPGQIGLGLWGRPALATAGVVVVLAAVTGAIVTRLPSFRSDREEHRQVLLGVGLAFTGAIPYFVSGSIFATSGIFDRNNLVPGLGVALVLASAWSLLRGRLPNVAIATGIAVLLWFAWMQVEDIRRFADAVDHGEQIVADLGARTDPIGDERLVIVPPQVDFDGMADFIYSGDLAGALSHRFGGRWDGVLLVESGDCSSLGDAGSVRVYDWKRRSLETIRPPDLPTWCGLWLD